MFLKCFAFISILLISSLFADNSPELIAFLGTEWCPNSTDVRRELLEETNFITSIEGCVHFREVDIESPDHADDPLIQKLAIEKLPTFVLFDEEFGEIARLEIKDAESLKEEVLQCAKDFERLRNAQEEELSLDEVQELYHLAANLGNRKLIQPLIARGCLLDRSGDFLVEKYRWVDQEADRKALRRQILRRKPRQDIEAHYQMARADFEGAQSKDPQRAIEPLMAFARRFGRYDHEKLSLVESEMSNYLFSRSEYTQALKHAYASLASASEGQKAEIEERIAMIRTYLD